MCRVVDEVQTQATALFLLRFLPSILENEVLVDTNMYSGIHTRILGKRQFSVALVILYSPPNLLNDSFMGRHVGGISWTHLLPQSALRSHDAHRYSAQTSSSRYHSLRPSSQRLRERS